MWVRAINLGNCVRKCFSVTDKRSTESGVRAAALKLEALPFWICLRASPWFAVGGWGTGELCETKCRKDMRNQYACPADPVRVDLPMRL